MNGGDHSGISAPDVTRVGFGPAPVLDHFGFFLEPGGVVGVAPALDKPGYHLTSPPLTAYASLLEASRGVKWSVMLEKWDSVPFDVIKRRVRKGIPDSLRGEAWRKLSGSDAFKATFPPGEYQRLLLMHGLSRADEMSIDVDLPRTYPNHYLFASQEQGVVAGLPPHWENHNRLGGGRGSSVGGTPRRSASAAGGHLNQSPGLASMRNVLRAFCVAEPDVGYCQGVGFVVGLFLIYLPEEEAFWLLRTLTREPRLALRGLWSPGLPRFAEVTAVFSALLAVHAPNVNRILFKHKIETHMYASHWFITLFTYAFRFDLVTRVWDAFLLEGWKVIFRVAIAALQKVERQLAAASNAEEILIILKRTPAIVDAAELMISAFKVPLKTSKIAEITKEWEGLHGEDMAGRVAQARQAARRRENTLAMVPRDAVEERTALLMAGRQKTDGGGNERDGARPWLPAASPSPRCPLHSHHVVARR